MNLLTGTTGNDTLNVSSAGSEYEIQGLAGNDTITGSAFGDLIVGGPGTDTMSGGGGDDTFLITGTESAYDTVTGGDGVDLVLGEAGDDTFRFLNFSGTNTVERIDGGGGVNIIAGAAATGSILNLSGAVLLNIARIVGGAGMDTITGSAGNDVIEGGLGKDTLSGGDGDDTFIITGADAPANYDSVSGGAGTDQILGGAGDDTFRFHIFSGASTVERIDGGGGVNVIAGHPTSGSNINLSGTVLVNISQLIGGAGVDTFTGSAGDDRISGGAANDTLVGGAGNDAALYSGNFSAYSITAISSTQWRVATTTASDGSDTVSGFETLEFADGTYSIATGVFTPFGPPNNPPVAAADLYSGTEDQPITVSAAAGVLANDSDPDGNPLSVSSFSAVSARGGTVAMNPDGSFTYTPAANINGSDSFSYTVSDGHGGTASATATLNLAPVNDAPLAVGNTYNATKDTPLTVAAAAGVLANDSDPDGQPLNVGSFDAASAQGGTVTMNTDGSFTYTPPAGFSGTDTFSYTASDGALSSSASVSLTVASALTLLTGTTGNDTLNVSSASSAYEIRGLAGNDTITGSAFGDLIVGGPGTDTMSGGGGDDTFLITGSESAYDTVTGGDGVDQVLGEAGDDTFRFFNFSGTNTVERIDGGGGVNIIATPAATSSILNLSGTVLVNIARIVGGAGTDTITGSAGNDVIEGGLGKDTLSGGDGDDTFIITGVDAAANYDSVSGGAGTDQILGGAGDDTFRFHIFSGASTVERIDGGGGVNVIAGHPTSGSNINLSGTVLVNISQLIGGAGVDTFTGSAGDDRISGGAANDTLVGGAGNDAALYSGNFSAYSITAISSTQWRVATTTASDGSDTVSGFETLEFADGTYSIATGVFTPFGPPNNPPVAAADLYSGTEDQPITVSAAAGVLANDSDPDGNPLSVSSFSAVSARGGTVAMNPDGSFTYTPAANINGSDSFSYTVSDGHGGTASATATLNLAPVNDAPLAVGNTYNATKDTPLTVAAAAGVLANDSDPDGQPLNVGSFDAASAQGGTVTMNTDGSFTYTPPAGFSGTDTFSYTASDGALSSSASVSIAVFAPNNPPVATGDLYSGTEDQPITVNAAAGVLANDSDPDGNPLSVSSFSAVSARGGTVAMNPDGSFTYTPAANINGSDSFSYTVSDGHGGTASATVTLDLAPVNDAPLAVGDSYNATKDTPLAIDITAGVLVNDSDPDGDALTASVSSSASAQGGTVTMNPDGSFTYTPAAGFSGTDTFSYTASDGALSSSASVSLTVAGAMALLVGTTGNNTLNVSSASSPYEIQGLAGNDTITGSGFGDLIVGGPGMDTMSGGGGDDTFLITGTESAYDTVTGGTGADQVLGEVGDDTFRFLNFSGTNTVERIDGRAGVNIIAGSATSNSILNLSGTALLNIARIVGGAGADTITGSAGNDVIEGGLGKDTLSGGDGDDTFIITGADAAANYDSVSGGAGTDRILGDAGDDTFRFLSFSGSNTVERIDGGAGLNIVAAFATSGSTIDLSGTVLVNIARIVGGAAMDNITGSPGNDIIEGGAGSDTMGGGDGDDTFIITGTEAAFDSVTGGRGYDQMLGGAGDDTFRFFSYVYDTPERIDGGGGLNVIAGVATSGSNVNLRNTVTVNISRIIGGAGTDTLIGSAGDDILSGGGGNDTLIGGLRKDTALYSGNFAAYSITPLSATQWRVATGGSDGADTVSEIEILEFADGTYSFATSTFTLFTAQTNHAPAVTPDSYNGAEDQAITVSAAAGALANDSDPDGHPLSVSASSTLSARGGSVAMNPDGSFTYTPPANINGIDSFYYTASDGLGGIASTTVSLSLAPVADAPLALGDTYKATKDTQLAVNLAKAGVLGNDSDADADVLTVSVYSATSAQGGTVAMNPDGRFTYTPPAGFTGTDTFSYTVSDGTLSSSASVAVDVGLHAPMSSLQSILTNLGEGEWAKLNTNLYSDVWAPVAQRPHERVTGSPASIITAWSGATWDTTRDKYIVWGGGHANYEGNEVYTWNANTLLWERASLPSAVHLISGAQFETVDGYLNAPIASHTYDTTEFLEIADRMIVFGGAAAHSGGAFVATNGTRTGPYLWDPSRADPNAVGGLAGSQVDPASFPNVTGGEMWENRDTWHTVQTGTQTDQTSDYARIDGKDVIFVTTQAGLYRYTVTDVNQPALDTWQKVGAIGDPMTGQGAGAYDPDLNIYLRTTGTKFTFWDLDTAPSSNISFTPFDPTGEFVLNQAYGMDYDPLRQKFVLWQGDSTVWLLDPPDAPSAAGWSIAKAPAGSQQGPNPPSPFTGVLGKWDYVAKYDIFVGLINANTGDIWAYKPSNWTPLAA